MYFNVFVTICNGLLCISTVNLVLAWQAENVGYHEATVFQ